jgi:hypothetical protein
MMVHPDTMLSDLLTRPFFWSKIDIIEFLGEEVGNMLDPAATKQSNEYQHAFISALESRADVELGGEYDEQKKQAGPSWCTKMVDCNPEYPLTGAHYSRGRKVSNRNGVPK